MSVTIYVLHADVFVLIFMFTICGFFKGLLCLIFVYILKLIVMYVVLFMWVCLCFALFVCVLSRICVMWMEVSKIIFRDFFVGFFCLIHMGYVFDLLLYNNVGFVTLYLTCNDDVNILSGGDFLVFVGV